MSGKYTALKGVEDVLPPESALWQRIEDAALKIFRPYGFQEIRPPMIERTELFSRSIGASTDIVEKEMYTFTDKGGRSVTLRPEGTASIVRAYVEHNLSVLPAPQKFFYRGPMFRYERPQRGRQRQFYQIGVEAFGVAGPRMDAEVITMMVRFLEGAGLAGLALELNSIGCEECRPVYREKLKGYLGPLLESLCADCARRIGQNPLRVLDCKVPGCAELVKNAPLPGQTLCEECRAHFGGLTALLDSAGINYTVNPRLVRGLDYYTRTTFEATTKELGAQNAVAAGGRYDNLVREFGGPETPAVGFAVGMERMAELLKETAARAAPEIFIASLGEEVFLSALTLEMASRLRAEGRWVELGYPETSLKSQMRRADKLGAALVIIIGEDELARKIFKWKDLQTGASGESPISEAYTFLKSKKI